MKEYCKNKMTTESKDELRSKLKEALSENTHLRGRVEDKDVVIDLLSKELRELKAAS
jgi:predicted nuclease with TOPRIM domain